MGRGEIRITSEASRPGTYRALRLVGRVSAARRRGRRQQRAVAVLWAVAVVAVAAVPTEKAPTLADGLRGMWPVAVAPVLIAILSSDLVWAWMTARAVCTPGRVDVRVDESGILAEHAGVGMRLAWSSVTTVAEGDEMVVFVAEDRRRLHMVALSLDHLTGAQAAAVRALARQALGERRWTTVRTRGSSPRLRVVPGAAGDARDVAPEPLPD